jgi:hypothetical protein
MPEESRYCPACGARVRSWRLSYRLRLGKVFFGAIIIWLGVSLYLQELGLLREGGWWGLFLAGLGGLLIARGLFLTAVRGRAPGSLLAGAILLLLGLSSLIGLVSWWLLLILIGTYIMLSGLRRR